MGAAGMGQLIEFVPYPVTTGFTTGTASTIVADVRSQLGTRQVVVLNPSDLSLAESELPTSWDVTSDSIAAYVASQLQAQELVLFKSTSLPANTNRAQAAHTGLIDGYFEQAAATIENIRWVNLRTTPVSERPLR